MAAVTRVRPSAILEVGTCKGERAVEMIRAAINAGQSPSYFGFDLFETLTPEDSRREFNVKHPLSLAEVRAKVRAAFPKVQAEFFKGLSGITLRDFVQTRGPAIVDFVWLDGGHSIETIRSDWKWCLKALRPKGIILLDDFYSDMEPSFTSKFGCNELVADLRKDSRFRVEILPPKDPVTGGGGVQIVSVTFA